MARSSFPPRTGAVLCPDWSVTAALTDADVSAATPAVVLRAGRVTAASRPARRVGIRVGMRQRDAQALCPQVFVADHDPGRDARLFEPVVAAVEDLVAGVEIVRPGLCVFTAAGPVRYAGGEEVLAEQIVDATAAACGVEAFVGFAEGIFAAAVAAARPAIVPPGETAQFLASVDVGALGLASLVDVLRRCGIHTLGALSSLPERSVVTRFGVDGVTAYRIASGVQETPVVARVPDVGVEVRMELDPPAERIQYATAAIHTAAEKFYGKLEGRGVVCTVVRIDAETPTGDFLSRTWRAEDVFSTEQIATRLRWQLEAWLTSRSRPTSGIHALSLVAEQTAPAAHRQMELWGAPAAYGARTRTAIDRAQDLLGIRAVTTFTLSGGRLPHEQAIPAVWRDDIPSQAREKPPWPDQVPPPITTFLTPIPVALIDDSGTAIEIHRHLFSDPPARLVRPGRPRVRVLDWAGPWPMRERWWDPGAHHHGAWLQVVVADQPDVESALLLFYDRRWWLAGSYD